MAEPAFPWVRPGGSALLQHLKSKPELNGQSVSIVDRDPKTGRWRCKVAPFGDEIKVKAENLAEASTEEGGPQEADGGRWLRRGAQAVIKGRQDLAEAVVRILTVDEAAGKCRCALRSTGEQLTMAVEELRPLAGATAAPAPEAPAAEVPAPAPAPAPRSDWRAAELERRRLAEGFRAGFEEGAEVVLQGLRSAPELNGRRGRLVAFNGQTLRWQVELEDDAGSKALNPTNLVPVGEGGTARKRPRREEQPEEPGEAPRPEPDSEEPGEAPRPEPASEEPGEAPRPEPASEASPGLESGTDGKNAGAE